MSYTVAIADPHDVTRWGVRSIVERFGGSVVDTAETGLDALSVVEEYKPTVLTLCLEFPRVSGFDILRHLQRRTVAVGVVVLTVHDEEPYVRSAFEQGASGYVRKRDPMEEVGTAIRASARGQHYLSDALPEAWMEAAGTAVSEVDEQYRALTVRQREVLRLTADGYTGEEVGEELELSCRTVEKHRQRIQDKLGLKNVVEMTRYAVHIGLYSASTLNGKSRVTQ
jgi:DNA-binding NarL/FixJ family response regulator